jgi:hypothetical protein
MRKTEESETFFLNRKPITVLTDKNEECSMSVGEYHHVRQKIESATETTHVALGEEKRTKPRASFTEGDNKQFKPTFTR